MRYKDKIRFLSLSELNLTMSTIATHLNMASAINLLFCCCYWVFKGNIISVLSICTSLLLLVYIVIKIIQFFILKREFYRKFDKLQEIRKDIILQRKTSQDDTPQS